MKRLLIISTTLVSMNVIAATPVGQPIGSSFTLGSAPNQRALSTALNNPAAPYIMVNQDDDDNFRFGIIGPINIGVEVGDVGNVSDTIDEMTDLTDSLEELDADDIIIDADVMTALNTAGFNPTEISTITGAETEEELVDALNALEDTYSSTPARLTALENAVGNLVDGAIQDVVDDVNEILDGVNEDAYLKAMVTSQVPFMPMIYRTDNGGAFMMDSSLSTVFKANLLEGVIDITDDYEIDATTSLYTRTAVDLSLGFGYSHPIVDGSYGMLIGGAKANIHKLYSGRSLAAVFDDDEDNEIEDSVTDSIDDAIVSTNIGVDLGIIWVTNHFQTGLTVTNINEPEFDVADVESTCGSDSCNAASSLSNSGDLNLTEDYTMEMQSTIDVAFSTKANQVTIGLSYDVNAVADTVGDEYQWAAASLSYYGDSHFLPGIRAGYRKNMAGTELQYVSAGLTLFKRLSLDVAVSLDTFEHEDEVYPRSVYLSLGYNTAF